MSPEETGCANRIPASDSWGAYQRNEFSEPKLLHLSMYRKALNTLMWDIWFSLTVIIWCSQIPASCCKNSCICYPPPHPATFSTVFSGLLEMLPPRTEILKMSTKPNITKKKKKQINKIKLFRIFFLCLSNSLDLEWGALRLSLINFYDNASVAGEKSIFWVVSPFLLILFFFFHLFLLVGS